MARPIKKGLSYFNLDCDNDLKTKIFLKKYSVKGYGFFIYILQNIYREGYYITLTDEEKEYIFLESGLEFSEADKIFNYLLSKNFFDKELYETFSVLTSKSIQERYKRIISDSNRTQKIIEYNLITSEETPVKSQETPITSEETLVTSEETPIKSEESTQRKEKKRNIKYNKEEYNKQNYKTPKDIIPNQDLNQKWFDCVDVWNDSIKTNKKLSNLTLCKKSMLTYSYQEKWLNLNSMFDFNIHTALEHIEKSFFLRNQFAGGLKLHWLMNLSKDGIINYEKLLSGHYDNMKINSIEENKKKSANEDSPIYQF